MGFRGPLTKPDSRRGSKSVVEIPTLEKITAPPHLNAAAKKIFRQLVEWLPAAKVPIKRVDVFAIANAARQIERAMYYAERAEDGEASEDFRVIAERYAYRYGRDADAALREIGGNPITRLRAGIKSAESKPLGDIAKMMEARRLR